MLMFSGKGPGAGGGGGGPSRAGTGLFDPDHPGFPQGGRPAPLYVRGALRPALGGARQAMPH